MRIPCPFCGLRDDDEFTYEGDADVVYPDIGAPEAAWVAAVFLRDQPRGRTRELWRHALGCRAWLIVERDNVTHEIFGARLARPAADAADGSDRAAAAEGGA